MRNRTPHNKIHSLAITAFLIATKFEDIIQPTLYRLCRLSGTYNIDYNQVQVMERKILETLDFDV